MSKQSGHRWVGPDGFQGGGPEWKPLDRATDIAIWLLVAVSFTTTTFGMVTLGDLSRRSGAFATVWWVVSVLYAGGLSLAIRSLALQVYIEFRVHLLVCLFCLSSVAAVFDAAFFSNEFSRGTALRTGPAEEETRRRENYDRLTKGAADVIAAMASELGEAKRAAIAAEAEQLQLAEYERSLRVDEVMRGCGPLCKEHLRKAARHRAEIEYVDSLLGRIASTSTSPRSSSWGDLESFHAEVADLVRTVPYGDAQLPAAPKRVALLTKGGNAAGVGGLGLLAELLANRSFDNVQLIVPLFLALGVEQIVVLLVLAGRPWRRFPKFVVAKLEGVEEFVDEVPAVAPLGWHAVRRGVLRDDPAARERRRKRNAWRRLREEHELQVSEIRAGKAAFVGDLDWLNEDVDRPTGNGASMREAHSNGARHDEHREGVVQ